MKNLRRILELAKRTGDRVILTDPDGEDAFVVMNLDQYESMLGLRLERAEKPEKAERVEDAPPPDLFDLMKPAGDTGDTWDLGKMSDGERQEVLRQFEAFQEETAVTPKPKSPPKAAQNDDLNEDQFYLEPIE